MLPEHYFEMSRPDAERALNIYKTFGRLTDQVVQYLSLARQYEMSTRLEVPKLKHAPTTLTSSLEEYLNDPDFEINRRQYLAQQEAKRTGKAVPMPPKSSSSVAEKPMKVDNSFPAAPNPAPAPARGPAPDLIDFFESIEGNQQTMAQSAPAPQQPYNTGYPQNQQYAQSYQMPQSAGPQMPQQTGFNPFMQQQPQQPQPLQTDFTGAGFGGYGPQPQQQYPQAFQYSSPLTAIPQNGIPDFSQQQQQPVPQVQSPQQLQPQQTSTNPFRQSMMPTGPPPITAQPTRSSTNPFAKHPTGPNSPFGQPKNNIIPEHPTQPQTQHHQLETQSSFFASSPQPHSGPPSAASLQPQRTGTNPFAKARSPPPQAQPLVASVTGTNPFRQSAFVNQQTGQGWQHSTQGTLFGLDMNTVPTTEVFPRPGAQNTN
jgi:phosphatidylinositol-binding clathrin assembly protein